MSEHDADVAAVLAKAAQILDPICFVHYRRECSECLASLQLADLTAAGYAVVKLPEGEMCRDCSKTALGDHEAPCRSCNGRGHTGVAIEHGAKLVFSSWVGQEPDWTPVYAIEATS